jgi:hypothetical protein
MSRVGVDRSAEHARRRMKRLIDDASARIEGMLSDPHADGA